MIEAEGYAIDALNRSSERGYRHQPVLDDGRLVGFLSRRELLGDEFTPAEEEYGHEQRI